MTANGGFEVAFFGEYLEIERPHRLVRTEVFEVLPDVEAVSTTTFDETNGVTTLRIWAAIRARTSVMLPSPRGWRVASKPRLMSWKSSFGR